MKAGKLKNKSRAQKVVRFYFGWAVQYSPLIFPQEIPRLIDCLHKSALPQIITGQWAMRQCLQVAWRVHIKITLQPSCRKLKLAIGEINSDKMLNM